MKTPINKENKILDNALDYYQETLKALIEAIESNIEQVNIGNENGKDRYIPMIRLQYVIDEIGEAKNLIN